MSFGPASAKDAKKDSVSQRPSRLPSRTSVNRQRAKVGPLRSTAASFARTPWALQRAGLPAESILDGLEPRDVVLDLIGDVAESVGGNGEEGLETRDSAKGRADLCQA